MRVKFQVRVKFEGGLNLRGYGTGEERKLKLNGKKRRRQKRRRNGGSKKSLELFFDMEGLLIT